MSDPHGAIPAHVLKELSTALLEAQKLRRPITPLTERYPGLEVGQAYEVAQLSAATELAAGAEIVGHKIGLTSVAVQEQLGVSEPDYAPLLDTMVVPNPALISLGDYIAPRIELELAFRLSAPLRGPGITAADVREATATVHPAFELCDSRVADWRIKLPDTIADFASGAAFIVGEAGLPLSEIDTAGVSVSLLRNGDVVQRGRSDAVLGDPCESVAWLANAVGAFGETLETGEVILSGAFAPMISIVAGDRFHARFDSGLGDLTLEVTE